VKPILQPGLRFSRTWFAVGVLIAIAIAVVSLMPPSKLPDLRVSDKFEHALSYFLLAFWFASVIVRRDYLVLVLSLLAFGGAIELVQDWMKLGRQADVLDLAADAVGIALGVALAATPLGRWAQWLERGWGARRP
jgi:VanZ family protein